MNQHARDIEPDLGPLLDLAEDLPEQDTSEYQRTEPYLEANGRKKPRFVPETDDGIALEGTRFSRKPTRQASMAIASPGSSLLTAWGGFWRAVVIGVVSGSVGGVVGAFTLVWLTGAGWSVFAKLLIDTIGRL